MSAHRRTPRALFAVALVACAGLAAPGCSTSSADGAATGPALYDKYCALCHGKAGEGYRADEAPALANPEFLAIASDAYLRQAIARGRPGTTMSAWSRARGGPLDDAQLDDLVRTIRSWGARPYASVDARVVKGDAARGQSVYDQRCATCHGTKGAGGRYNKLANAEFLAAASDGFLAASIEVGRPGTPMPAFRSRFSEAERDDVVALLRSWATPVSDTAETPPRPGKLAGVVTNPGGPDTTLDATTGFVPADQVKAEIDRGAALVLLDARAPSDYVASHIRGAVDVPFYEVEAYMPELPRDRFIVTYCGCPHAASGKARDVLKQNGYPRVAVLDEGFYVWRDRGYPVKSGAGP